MLLRLKTFVVKHWQSFLAALAGLAVLLAVAFKRSRPDPAPEPVIGPSSKERMADAHAAGNRERAAALADRGAQERAAQESAELEAAAKLRAEEAKLAAATPDASSSAAAANDYADRVSARKAGSP